MKVQHLELERWGLWVRKREDGQAYPRTTGIGRARSGHIRLGIHWRSCGYSDADEAIDTDRRISALPKKYQRVLVVEYVIWGSVEEKLAAAGMTQATYYRTLKRAAAAVPRQRYAIDS